MQPRTRHADNTYRSLSLLSKLDAMLFCALFNEIRDTTAVLLHRACRPAPASLSFRSKGQRQRKRDLPSFPTLSSLHSAFSNNNIQQQQQQTFGYALRFAFLLLLLFFIRPPFTPLLLLLLLLLVLSFLVQLLAFCSLLLFLAGVCSLACALCAHSALVVVVVLALLSHRIRSPRRRRLLASAAATAVAGNRHVVAARNRHRRCRCGTAPRSLAATARRVLWRRLAHAALDALLLTAVAATRARRMQKAHEHRVDAHLPVRVRQIVDAVHRTLERRLCIGSATGRRSVMAMAATLASLVVAPLLVTRARTAAAAALLTYDGVGAVSLITRNDACASADTLSSSGCMNERALQRTTKSPWWPVSACAKREC